MSIMEAIGADARGFDAKVETRVGVVMDWFWHGTTTQQA
jgi:hypothetical protein